MTASQSGELRSQFAYPTAQTALVQPLALLQLNSVFAIAQDRSPQPAQSVSVPSIVSHPGAVVQSAKVGSEHARAPAPPPLPPDAEPPTPVALPSDAEPPTPGALPSDAEPPTPGALPSDA